LSAGLRVVTSNLGALPETTEGWSRMYPYLRDPSLHAQRFADILLEEIELVRAGKLDEQLNQQVEVYNSRWSWDYRIKEWLQFLDGLF
jgi:glycosyltransferase involved in cell wall biosynthesis